MGITLFDDCGNEITEEIADITGALDAERIEENCRGFAEAFEKVAAAFNAMVRRIKEAFAELVGEIPDVDFDEKTRETQERRCASILAAQKAAARAKAYGLRMLLEKAHRTLKRRKRLHNDGGLPDW